jgi:O-antigen/teichoic acid export membrane protein
MKKVDTRYWVELAVITLFMIGLGCVAFLLVFPGHYPPVLPVLLAIIVIMTAAGQVVLTRFMDQKFSQFNSAFLIYKTVKILILMAFMIIYSLLHREMALPFLVSTLILYLVYVVFESRSLSRHSKNQAVR